MFRIVRTLIQRPTKQNAAIPFLARQHFVKAHLDCCNSQQKGIATASVGIRILLISSDHLFLVKRYCGREKQYSTAVFTTLRSPLGSHPKRPPLHHLDNLWAGNEQSACFLHARQPKQLHNAAPRQAARRPRLPLQPARALCLDD
jgi:hypothetical protein